MLRLEAAGARAVFQRDLVGRVPNVPAVHASRLLPAHDALLRGVGLAVCEAELTGTGA